MEYRGFEFYATEVPREFVAERLKGCLDEGFGKVFACEIYTAGDEGLTNVLDVFDLVEGQDIPVDCEEALITALRVHVDKNYEQLIGLVQGRDVAVKQEPAVQQGLQKDVLYADAKAQVLALYESIAVLREKPGYQIAVDMTYLLSAVCLHKELTDDEAFVLASKLDEAHGSWFAQPILHSEYLTALGDLLENGVTSHNNPDFPELSAEDTLKLLLGADNVVFGTLVESAAVQNCYRYLPDDYQVENEYIEAVERAIEAAMYPVENVEKVISQAAQKVEVNPEGKDRETEKVIV